MAGQVLTSRVAHKSNASWQNKALSAATTVGHGLAVVNARGAARHSRRGKSDRSVFTDAGRRWCAVWFIIPIVKRTMPAFGKVHSAIHTGVDRVKSGLKWAGHKYRQGMHLAGRANDLYQTGKKIAGIFMPELQRLGVDQAMLKGFGAMDHMRDTAISRHQDVLDRISENSAIVSKMRQSQQMIQPYYA